MRRFPALVPNFIPLARDFFPPLQRLPVKPSLTIQQDITEAEQTGAPAVDELKRSSASRSGKEKSLLAVSLAFFLCIIVKDAWLSDDAYITFRTVASR